MSRPKHGTQGPRVRSLLDGSTAPSKLGQGWAIVSTVPAQPHTPRQQGLHPDRLWAHDHLAIERRGACSGFVLLCRLQGGQQMVGSAQAGAAQAMGWVGGLARRAPGQEAQHRWGTPHEALG